MDERNENAGKPRGGSSPKDHGPNAGIGMQDERGKVCRIMCREK